MKFIDHFKNDFINQFDNGKQIPPWLTDLKKYTALIENREEEQFQYDLVGKNKEVHELLHRITCILQSREHYYNVRLKIVTEAIGVGLWEMDVQEGDPINPEHEIRWSQEFRHMLGYEDEHDFPNRFESWSTLLHPDDEEQVLEKFMDHLFDYSGDTKYDEEYRLLTKTGQYKWFRSTGTTIRDCNGNPIMVAGALFDINDTKKKEDTLNQLVDRVEVFNKVLVEVPWDMNVVLPNPLSPIREVLWSDQFREMLGFKDVHDFPNLLSSWINRLHPDDFHNTIEAINKHLFDYTGQTNYTVNFRLRLNSGEYRWYYAHGDSVRDKEGKPLKFAGTIRDISRDINKEEMVKLVEMRMNALLDDIRHL